jgi:hypothetical protein
MRTRLLLLLPALLFACSSNGTNDDGGIDSGNGSDVQTSDVQANDAGTDSPSGDGGCGPWKYCEDFESYGAGAIANGAKLGPWKATVQGTGVVFQVDNVKPYAGKQSLHITVPTNAGMDAGTSARGTLNQAATGGLIPGNDMFGRAMVFYSNTGGNDLPLGVHSWLFNSGGNSSEGDGGVTMNMGGGGAKLQLNYHPPLPLTEQSVQGGNITAGAWHCIQWQYDGSGSGSQFNDAAHVWIDGTDVVDVAKTKGWWFATPWDTFDFGFTHYQALANGVDVYLDDFALDGAMIPCPP